MSSPTPNSSQLSDPTESLGKTLDELESKLVRHAPRLRDSPRSQAIRERIAGLPERLDRHAHPTRERIENARGEGRQRRVGDEMEEEDEDQVDDPEADELEADELEADELEAEKQSSPQPALTKAAKRQLAITTIAQKILGCRLEGKPIMFVQTLLKGKEDRVGKATDEREGFIILMKGYQPFNAQEMYEWRNWQNVIKTYRTTHTLEEQCVAWNAENSMDVEKRIYSRRNSLETASNEQAGSSYLHHLCHQARTIMFMTDYNKRKKGQGGSAFVREYYTKAFQEHPKHRYKFAGLNNDEKLAKMGELNQQYQVWKREEETVVTARNRLFEMYTLFGPAVLLDRRWSIDNLAKASKEFAGVLKFISRIIRKDYHNYCQSPPLSQEESPPHYYHAKVQNAETLILRLAQVLGDEHSVDLLKTFLAKYQFDIPPPDTA